MPNFLKTVLRAVSRNLLVLVALGGMATVALAFTEPSVAPTGGTVYAPVNTGGTAQTKSGSFTSSGTLTGNILNATTQVLSPQYCIGASCITSWPAGGGITSVNGMTGPAISIAAGTGISVSNLSNIVTITNTGGGGTPGGVNGHVQFNNAGAFGGDKDLFWNNTTKMLGVGTKDPLARLHIKGAGSVWPMIIEGGLGSEFTAYGITNNMSTGWGIGMWGSGAGGMSNDFWIGYYNGVWSVNLSIDKNTGNVGIGTDSPGATLEVNGDIQTTPRETDCPVGWTCMIKTWDVSLSGIYYSTFLARSDARLKRDIAPLTDGLSAIKNLQGVSFKWKEGVGDSSTHYGFIAQDVEKVLPQLVHETPEGMKSLEKEGIIPVLVEAVKEQQKEIESLKAENVLLNARMEALEKK